MRVPRHTTNAAALAVAAILAGCSEPAGPVDEPIPVAARCDGGVSSFEISVDREISAVGPSSNELVALDGDLLVVESGANHLSRYSPGRDALESFVDVGTERNPYAAAVDEAAREVWIANYASHSVTVADADTGQVLREIEGPGLRNPSAVALTEDFAYVGNVHYVGPPEGFGEGSVAVIRRATGAVEAEIATAFKNPQFLTVAEIHGEPTLVVSGGGAYQLGEEVRVISEGGLELFGLGDDPVEPAGEAFPLGQEDVGTVGAPGRPLVRGERIYATSGNAPALFVFDLSHRAWEHDAGDPFWLYEDDGSDLTHSAALADDGLLLVTAFNRDALYVFDVTCMEKLAGPIDLGRVANMLEGPRGIEFLPGSADGAHRDAYFLYSIANALGRVRLTPTGESP